MKSNFNSILLRLTIIGFISFSAFQSFSKEKYKGKPFSNTVYKGGAQTIPGKLQCEYYDLGGEGIAFHDTDTINSGSGGLNPADGTYLN